MFTPTSGQVSSLMCQHGMGSEAHLKPSFFSFACILYVEVVNDVTTIQVMFILKHVENYLC
jgi:hypothetical protein